MAKPEAKVEGEGSYEATRRYNAGLKRSVEAGKSDALAEEAKRALEGPEGDVLRRAEEEAKRRAAPSAPAPRGNASKGA